MKNFWTGIILVVLMGVLSVQGFVLSRLERFRRQQDDLVSVHQADLVQRGMEVEQLKQQMNIIQIRLRALEELVEFYHGNGRKVKRR